MTSKMMGGCFRVDIHNYAWQTFHIMSLHKQHKQLLRYFVCQIGSQKTNNVDHTFLSWPEFASWKNEGWRAVKKLIRALFSLFGLAVSSDGQGRLLIFSVTRSDQRIKIGQNTYIVQLNFVFFLQKMNISYRGVTSPMHSFENFGNQEAQ